MEKDDDDDDDEELIQVTVGTIDAPKGGGASARQPPHPSQSEILKNMDFVDTMILRFYVIYASA